MPPSRFREPSRGPQAPRRPSQPKHDPGSYIGRLPERVSETIPGGVGPQDERASAVATQPAPVRGQAPASEIGTTPEGHREPAIDPEEQRRADR
jgi:hypothetical protein